MAPPATDAEAKPSPSPSSSSGPAGAGGETTTGQAAGGEVLLVAACGTKVPLSRSAARMSKVILDMMNEGMADINFVVREADARTLRLVAAYCEKHGAHYDPAAASAGGLRDPFAAFPIDLRPAMEAIKPVSVPDPDPHGLKDWDDKFIKALPDNSNLYGIINAANLLYIEELLDLGCMTVADMMRGKTPEEIRLALDIENDYTPEQEAEVRRENAWAFED